MRQKTGEHRIYRLKGGKTGFIYLHISSMCADMSSMLADMSVMCADNTIM